MDDKKLKIAFLRVKNDYNALNKQLLDIKSKVDEISEQLPLNSDIERSLRKLEKVDLEKFTTNLEIEFKNINRLIGDFNKRFIDSGEIIKKFSRELEGYNKEIESIKTHMVKTTNTAANANLDVNLMGERFAEMQELLSEKMSVEIASVRIEFIEEISKLYEKLNEKKEKSPRKEVKNSISKTKKTSVKTKTQNAKKLEPGKIKRAVKWLIDGDDEDDLKDIKKEIGK